MKVTVWVITDNERSGEKTLGIENPSTTDGRTNEEKQRQEIFIFFSICIFLM